MGVVLIFVGGALGSRMHYGVAVLLTSPTRLLPYGTLLVNLLGCLLLGYLMASPLLTTRLSEPMRLGLGTGLLGGFTTFSTFGVESMKLFQTGELLVLLGYTLASVLGGFAAAYVGMRLASGG